MKVILHEDKKYILRFDKGEEVFGCLTEFMKDNSVSGCAFSAIGACSFAELGYYNTKIKGYSKKEFFEDMEIISIIGNGSLKEGNPIIHAHGSFAKTDYNIIGGHIFKLVISATCEIFLTVLEGGLKRELNSDMNMNWLS
jgi:uncharacterized protein